MPEDQHVKLVITGAPGSGKTLFMERISREPELSGFLFFEELARQILSEQPDLRNDRTTFHREIYRRQTKREDDAAGHSFVTDRGTVDAFAFHPETIEEVGTTLAAEYARYSGVIQLGSAAILGEPYYTRDDIRQESPADALVIEDAIRKVWSGHGRYAFVPASIDLEKKYGAFRRQVVDYMRT